jgi:hypothetical protein
MGCHRTLELVDTLYASEKCAWRSKEFRPSASLVAESSPTSKTGFDVEEKRMVEGITHVEAR